MPWSCGFWFCVISVHLIGLWLHKCQTLQSVWMRNGSQKKKRHILSKVCFFIVRFQTWWYFHSGSKINCLRHDHDSWFFSLIFTNPWLKKSTHGPLPKRDYKDIQINRSYTNRRWMSHSTTSKLPCQRRAKKEDVFIFFLFRGLRTSYWFATLAESWEKLIFREKEHQEIRIRFFTPWEQRSLL